ncbi:MAG: hypothetical protein V5B78_08250 [Desulfohalobiaceae bacterium]
MPRKRAGIIPESDEAARSAGGAGPGDRTSPFPGKALSGIPP